MRDPTVDQRPARFGEGDDGDVDTSRYAGTDTSTAQPAPTGFGQARYRVWQFWRSITARRLDASDRALVERLLPPGGQRVFATMTVNDQRHSVTVCRALLAQGCRDRELLAAALLHDSGKGAGRVPLWVRPTVVLLRAVTPGALRWLARAETPWWRRPFYAARHHAAIGADLASAAGMPERVVLLIRTHHDPNGPAAALHAVDEGV